MKIVLNGGTAGAKATVAASAAVTATLETIAGVRAVTWSVAGTDETRTAVSYTLTQSGSIGQTCALTAGAEGTAGIIKATCAMRDGTTQIATAKWCVLTSSGSLEVGATAEESESDATYGWVGVLNGAVRAAGASAVSSLVSANVTASATALTDASQTITVAGGKRRSLPTLTAERTYTLSTSGATTGDTITIERSSSVLNYRAARIVNGGAGGGAWELNTVGRQVFRFDGTNWALERTPVKSGEYIINVKDFGARGDGSTDDTTAIQNAINVATRNGSGLSPCATVYFPRGVYNVSSGLTYTGDQASTVKFIGDQYAQNQTGTTINYTGGAGATLFKVNGGNNCLIKSIEFKGNGNCTKLIHLGYDFTNSAAGNGHVVEDVNLLCGTGAASGTILLALGDVSGSTYQVAQVTCSRVRFYGDSVTPANVTGWKTLNSGNVKNFYLHDCQFIYLHRAVDRGSASGNLRAHRCEMGLIGTCFYLGGQPAEISSCAVEGGAYSGGTMFIDSAGTGGIGRVVVSGCYVNVETPTDDFGINYAGALILIGNEFTNERGSFAANPFKIKNGAILTANGVSDGSIISLGNCYRCSTLTEIPAYETASNQLGFDASYSTNKSARIVSIGDSASATILFKHMVGMPVQNQFLAAYNASAATGSGITWPIKGETCRNGWFAKTYTYAAFQAAAATKTINVGRIEAKQRLKGIYLDTTAAFTGTAGGVELRAGTTTTGQELLLAHDVKSAAVQKGFASGDLGASVVAVQGGTLFSWTAATTIYLYMQEMGGNNLSGLSAGSVTIWWEVDSLVNP